MQNEECRIAKEGLQVKPNWISVYQRLPEIPEEDKGKPRAEGYLVALWMADHWWVGAAGYPATQSHMIQQGGYISHDGTWMVLVGAVDVYPVAFWMPFPEPPKAEEESVWMLENLKEAAASKERLLEAAQVPSILQRLGKLLEAVFSSQPKRQ